MRKPNIDRKALLLGSVLLILLSFALCFFPRDVGRYAAAGIALLGAVVAYRLLRKRSSVSVHSRGVLFVVVLVAVIYPVLVLLSGLKFGFYRADVTFSFLSFFTFVLPIAVTIIATEIIRGSFLGQKGWLPALFAYFIGVFFETLMQTTFSHVTGFNRFMDLVGLAFLPALAAGALYQYTAKRYGLRPAIVYRLIVTLFPYIVPIKSGIPDSLVSMLSLLVPLLLLLLLRLFYGKTEKRASKRTPRWVYAMSGVVALLMISFVMLISCQVRFCLLVIATESMTGEIDKGDAVIYEQFSDQVIREGDVIVFNKYDLVFVHRVIEVSRIDGENRYVTKGDANDDADVGYITDVDVIGVVGAKIPYVGYPTLWLKQAFE